jgi:flagellar biosynthesis GTPase FlhF
MSTATSVERRLHASANAHLSWANTQNRSARTAPARAARDQKFLEQAGGDPVRAAHLRKAYFAKLAAKSAQARRRVRELTETAEQAEAGLAEAGGPDAA